MTKDIIKKVLCAPVSFVRYATDKEKRIFSIHPNTDVPSRTNKNGRFYTIGLKSKQNFIAHIPYTPYHESVFTVRPLNPLSRPPFLPNLREIQWGYEVTFGGSGVRVQVHFYHPTSKEIEESYKRACLPEWTGFRQGTMIKEYKYNPLWEYLSQIKYAQDDYRESIKKQEEARDKLAHLLISNNNNFIQQQKGENQNVRN